MVLLQPLLLLLRGRVACRAPIRHVATTATTASAPATPATAPTRSDFLAVYRCLLWSTRWMTPSERAASMRDKIRSEFREHAVAHSTTSSSSSSSSTTTDALAIELMQRARSTLAFVRMSMPRHKIRLTDFERELERERTQRTTAQALRDVDAGVATYRYNRFGELVRVSVVSGDSGESVVGSDVPANELDAEGKLIRKWRGRLSNSQGITDDQLRRHHALMERFHFRGPHWANKR